MITELKKDSVRLDVSLDQVKKIYVALFKQLHASQSGSLADFDDDDLLLDLQMFLQKKARQENVDGTIHSEWERFLGMQEMPSCEERFASHH
ncbi:MAG: hypothetical protein AB7N71_05445 [Phycisphaerae bacterium]